MKKILTLAAVALLAMTGASQAAILNITLGPSFTYSTGGAPLSPNINLQTYGGLLLGGNAFIVAPPSSLADEYLAPNGGVGLFGNNFLAVQGDSPSGAASFILPANQNVFSFTWGSIDSYNTIKLFDSNGVTYTLTGTDILNNLAGSVEGTTDVDVHIIDPLGNILTALLTSTFNSFEVANFGFATTEAPLPPALLLFGAALLSLAWIARSRRKTV